MKRQVIKSVENDNIWIDVETGCVINNYVCRGEKVQKVIAPRGFKKSPNICNDGKRYPFYRTIALTMSNTVHTNSYDMIDYDVHHISANHDDNSYWNLLILEPSTHRRHHRYGISIEKQIAKLRKHQEKIIRKNAIMCEVDDDKMNAAIEFMSNF